MGECLVGTGKSYGFRKSGHKVGDCRNVKGKDKGCGKSQTRCSNVDAPRKNHFYALVLGMNNRVLLI